MQRNIFPLLILALAVSGQAQILAIKDKVTRQPLAGVSVHSKNPAASGITDARGHVELSKFKNADSIHIDLIGYQRGVYSYKQLEEMQFTLFLEETSIPLNGVVVSAVRWAQAAREVPNKIASIRATEVNLQNPQTAADLLGASGEIFIQKSQLGGGSPMIRGFATNRVLIAVDGVRMNNAIFRSGNLQNVIALDPFATENAEVVFGPGSVIYGSDAIGGVMGFHTLAPKFSTNGEPLVRGSATVRNSSASFEKTGHAHLNIGLQKWAFLSSVTYTDFDNLKMGSNGPDEYLRREFQDRVNGQDVATTNPDPEEQTESGYSQLNLMQKIRFEPNAAWNFSYGFHYSASTDVPRYDRLIEYRRGRLRSAEWYYGPQKWLMNALNLQHARDRGWYDNARLTLAYQHFEESRHDRNFGDSRLNHRSETVNAYSANLDFDKSWREKHRLFYGAEVVFNRVGSVASGENIATGATVPISTRYPDGSTWNSYAAYLSYRFHASRKVILQSGLRYNLATLDAKFDTRFFPFPFTSASLNTGALTGSTGVVYNPDESWNLSANFSTGFRAPNIDDVGKVFDSAPGSVIVPNPGLKPEYAYNTELGIAKTFGSVAKADVAGYFTFLDAALVRRNFTLNGQDSIVYDGALSQVQAIQNAANAHVYGIQAGLELKLPAGFTLSSRFNFQKGEEELDDGSTAPLRHAGPWFGTTHLIYRRDRLKADFYGVYNGEISFDDLAPEERGKPHIYAVDANGNPHSPSWYTLNLKVQYQLADLLMLIAGVENITDQRYRPYSSGIVAPGRNFIAAVKASF
ncbi:MAG: TonB-dependent receptor [candidate division KSB1 bacterium]|nr:TonB-dependent receptor [candidate division KSB1 bacterium]MDZ7367968.1 TonB-dependent receptor [candidate division KSB1 bacterium]MDZ7405591.1 TonB-dependent receptor [candidate division KSB1 bacterium]